MTVDEAKNGDMQQLARHHRQMFEEIWGKKGLKLDAARAEEVEKAYLEKLKKQLPDGGCKAWVIKDGSRVVASGAISILSYVPVPYDTNSTVAYLHSLYTEEDCRGRKLAKRIIEKAIQYCREQGINRVFLNASDAGKPLYEKIGFSPSPNSLRLIIK